MEQAHCRSSFSPISEAFDIMQDDATKRTSKQKKSIQQRQYRDKEVDSFAELREAIREVTDDQETPGTRHETLSKAAQYIRQLSWMNLRLHQHLSILKLSQMNDESCVTIPTQLPTMPLHWSSDIDLAVMHRTTDIIPQSTLHDFSIGVSSGVCGDATVPEGAQDQTNTIPRRSDSLRQINHYTSSRHPLNQSHISYDIYSY
ncbi:uncharacterized protein EDB91DRAFT_1245034 [Suillus paluster]|uniref:uncharacterized protein n=1 Tax=Suillus paluster TaxID=48578 RepID=UPI001B868F59|nr:uncharacterized protein EDB91DRAFT_1245034 [Suillus paluster]KAG1748326.1 hypothetical protein EDB91DRAFT_1245034 [Suillus paluster]